MKTFVYKSEQGRFEVEDFYRKILDSESASGFTKRYIGTTEGQTFVLEKSDPGKPPLVLIHGSMSNSATWIGIIPSLAKTFSVYCLDIPGEPGLSDPWRFSLKSESPSRWIEAVLDVLRIEKASFLGMSLGSWYILNFAAAKPERTAAISLITTGGIVPQKTSFLLMAIVCSLMGKTGKNLLNKAIYHKVEMIPELNDYQDIVSANFIPLMEVLPIFSDDQLARLTMPIQYFGGDKDVLLDTKKTALRLKKLPKAEINVLRDTGHVIIDRFDEAASFFERCLLSL